MSEVGWSGFYFKLHDFKSYSVHSLNLNVRNGFKNIVKFPERGGTQKVLSLKMGNFCFENTSSHLIFKSFQLKSD